MHYRWDILQTGEISLHPDGSRDESKKHACTSTIIWREDKPCIPLYAIITDPCFIGKQSQHVENRLNRMGFRLPDIGKYFITHSHWDHQPRMHHHSQRLTGTPINITDRKGLKFVPCPGHHVGQNALVFTDANDKKVWIVGDAVINEEWLRAWGYFWPNQYDKQEINQHWRDIATIIAKAEIIIPGHGSPITVTWNLVEDMIESFPTAEFAANCPEVLDELKTRLAEL